MKRTVYTVNMQFGLHVPIVTTPDLLVGRGSEDVEG